MLVLGWTNWMPILAQAATEAVPSVAPGVPTVATETSLVIKLLEALPTW
jgi:hypothetical protein